MVTTSLYEQIYTVKQFEKAKKFKPIKNIEIFQPNSRYLMITPEINSMNMKHDSTWNCKITLENGETTKREFENWFMNDFVELELKHGAKIIVNYETSLKAHSYKAPAKKCKKFPKLNVEGMF